MLDKNKKINPKVGLAALLAAWCFLFVSTAGASSLVPDMYSNTSPSPYVVSASSFVSTSYMPYRAFDGISMGNEAWRSGRGQKSGWLKLDLGSGNAQAVNVYRILCEENSGGRDTTGGRNRAPRDFVFQGSDNGSLWVDLDVQSGVMGWNIGELKQFSFDNDRPYRYYRLNITANNGDKYYLSVQELELEYNVTYVPPSPSAKPAPVLQYKSLLGVAYPLRMAQDGAGDIFVASVRGHSVVRFDKYGHAKGTDASVADPTAVAASPSGELYIASGSGGVYRSGFDVPFISKLMAPSVSDMVFDSAGYLYVVDTSVDVVMVFSPDGSPATTFGGGEGMYPVSLAVGSGMSVEGSGLEEQVYVGYATDVLVTRNESMVVVYEPGSWLEVRSFGKPYSEITAETTTEGVDGLPEPYQIVRASGIAVDKKGRVYVADTYGGRIVMFDESGDYFASTEQMVAPPSAVSFDVDGRLLVSIMDGSVRIYSVDGSDVANVAPTAPRFVSPSGGVSVPGAVELLVKNSDDLNGDTLVYEFVLASDPAMRDVVWSQLAVEEGVDGKTSATVGAVLAEDTDYYWKARSLDARGEYSQYSPVTAFFLNGLNSSPVIISSLPEEQLKKIYVEEALDFSVETFDSDRDRLTVSWLVDGEPAAEGASAFEFVGVADGLGSHKLVARVSDREFAVYKEWDVEVYRLNTKPVPPSVASPSGSEDVDTLMPVLTVNNASDAEGDKLEYTFEVSTVSDFSPGSIVAVVSGVAEGEGLTSAALASDLEENTLYYWRAMAVEVAKEGAWVREYYSSDPSVEVASFFVNSINDVSSTPSVSHPSSGSEVTVLTPELIVDRAVDVDINDTLTYQFQLASHAGFDPVNIDSEGSVSPTDSDESVVYAPGVELEDNKTYYWRARAMDDSGLASSWVTASFRVNTENDAPTTPEVVSPLSGVEVSAEMPELVAAESSDLDNDPLQYIFEVDASSSFDSPARQRAVVVSSSWTVTDPLADNTDYFWRVKARDDKNAESPWSIVGRLFVNTANDAPTVPIAKYPSSSAVVNLEMPAFGVYEATDADRDSVSYIYQVSKDSAFAQDVIESGLEGTEWLVGVPLDENGDYFWRAGSVDEHGLSSGWSGASAFRVNIANDPPSAPVIGWQHVPSGTDALLEINNSIDLDGDALSYDVEVYSDRAMSNRVVSVQGLDEGGGITMCNIGQLPNGLYYWRARATDGEVYGSWSGSRVLRVDNAPANPGNTIIIDGKQGRKRY